MTETTGMYKRLIALTLAVSLAGVSTATAQPLPAPLEDDSILTETVQAPDQATVSITAETDGAYNITEPVLEHFNLWHSDIALTESTGTWLDRGYWYSQIEAVIMNRQWERHNLILAFDNNSNRKLALGRSDPGREGSVRFTLGRFLFRDEKNRDHKLEFTAFGSGQFGQDRRLQAVDQAGLVTPSINVPFFRDMGSIVSFDGAESMYVRYDSRFNNFELNYVASTRLDRDRMELMPSGEWVRRANAGLTWQLLTGIRYFDLTENLDWQASNINEINTGLAGENGDYRIRTSNDAFGPQIGLGLTVQKARFSIGTMAKMALLGNDSKARSSLSYTDPVTGETNDLGFTTSDRTDTFSLLSEFSIMGRYHMRPNISLRAGYNLLYVTETALATHQINFAPNDATVITSGDSFYHGLSTGLDFYW